MEDSAHTLWGERCIPYAHIHMENRPGPVHPVFAITNLMQLKAFSYPDSPTMPCYCSQLVLRGVEAG